VCEVEKMNVVEKLKVFENERIIKNVQCGGGKRRKDMTEEEIRELENRKKEKAKVRQKNKRNRDKSMNETTPGTMDLGPSTWRRSETIILMMIG